MKAALAILLLAFGFPFIRADELPAAWPDGWREAYGRFEKFLADRERHWPESGLAISAEGEVRIEVQFEETRESHRTLALFQDGTGGGSSGLGRSDGGGAMPIFNGLLPERPNAAVLLVVGVFGYQYVPPIVWFEIEPEPGMERTLFGGRDRKIRVLPAPEPAEDFLPNERLLAWQDFQVLPKRNPNDIRKGNRKVTPAVFLQVDRSGTVHRKPLEEDRAEAALAWRVYFNGRLVHRAAAGGQERLDVGRNGVGNYTVLAGVDGPSGFLPVSNLLRFTLGPGREKPELLFSKFDYGRPEDYPAWYAAVLPSPLGSGPAVFSTDAELAAARVMISAWKGCADLFNAPGSSWILLPTNGDGP